MGDEKTLSIKHMVEILMQREDKLLAREDKFLYAIEKLDAGIDALKDDGIIPLKTVIITHESAAEQHRKTCDKAHNELNKTMSDIKKGDRSLINTVFKIAVGVFIFLAIGKEFIGVEAIKAWLQGGF